jgi:gliding motility-associated-like protein
MKVVFIAFLLWLFYPTITWASHFIGGEFQYKIIKQTPTTNSYELNLYYYSDCQIGKRGSPLPNQVEIYAMGKTTGQTVKIFIVPLGDVKDVPAPPCTNVTNVCIKRGEYRLIIDLPIIAETLAFIHSADQQNRSGTIENVYAPNGYGSTYFAEISEEGQRLGNASARFKALPPSVLCVGEAIEFDHSATDSDGDSLVYKFTNPKGQTLKYDYVPGSFPPSRFLKGFDKICYQLDTSACENYLHFDPRWGTLEQPFGGNIKLNAQTGKITGETDKQGYVVYCLVVEEYRNGRLMGLISRDIQFFFAACSPIVKAQIAADTIIDKKAVLINCLDKSISIKNLSIEKRYISTSYFQVFQGKDTVTYGDWEPIIAFPDTGLYKGRLILNPSTRCGDTLNLEFRLQNRFRADFTMTYDSCKNEPIVLMDKSVSENGKLTDWKWQFNDSKDSVLSQNTSHIFTKTGENSISLTTKDDKGCRQTKVKNVNWYPSTDINLSKNTEGALCSPAKVILKNKSIPLDSTYRFQWFFDNNIVSDSLNPKVVLEKPAQYSILVKAKSPIGCVSEKTFPDFLTILQGVKADFEYTPENLSTTNNKIQLIDKSIFSDSRQWLLNKRFVSKDNKPFLSLLDTGLQKISLIAFNKNSCRDTVSKSVDVEPIAKFWLPTAFTPNEDALNDVFKGVGLTDYFQSFDMKILNRWGELVFQTQDAQKGWNGHKLNTGEECPDGVYLCHVTYKTVRGKMHELRNFITIIR